MTDTIPTLTTTTEAEALLSKLAESHDWVSVFWDKRDRRTPEITIMVDGDGQTPKAAITDAVYRDLVAAGTVGKDTYAGFHARRIHDFCVPLPPEKTGPTVNEVIEEVLRELFAEHDVLPLKTAFFRGINKAARHSMFANPINEDVLTTGGYRTSVSYVNVHPGGGSPIITAWDGKGMFSDKLGDGTTVQAPRNGDEIDVEGLRSPGFREELLNAIRQQLALLPA